MARWTRILGEAPPLEEAGGMTRGVMGLRAEGREVVPDPRQLDLPGPVLGQLQPPRPRRADQAPSDREEAAPQGFGALEAGAAQRVALVEHEQIERQDFQLEIGRIGPERAGGDAVAAR